MRENAAWFLIIGVDEGGIISYLTRLICSSVLIAVGVLVPMVFHFLGGLGKVFLPMHIPVFIAGLLLGPYYGMAVGGMTPVLSSLFTGMPPVFPVLPVMVVELAGYGLISGYGYEIRKWPFFTVMILSMAAGRIAAAMTVWCLAILFGVKLDPFMYLTAAVVTGIPGIVIQAVIIPTVVKKLKLVFLHM